MQRISTKNTAILASVVIAALGIWLICKFGNPSCEPALSLAFGLILIGAAFGLTRKSNGLLTGGGINPTQIAQVREIIASDVDVESVGQLQTVQLGANSVLLTAGVCFAHRLSPRQVEHAIERIERSIKEQYPAVWRLCLEAEPRQTRSQPH